MLVEVEAMCSEALFTNRKGRSFLEREVSDMSATLCEIPVDLDEMFYQSVVDEEFRAQLLADPGLFGLSEPSLVLPTPVEPQDEALLDLASGADFVAQCRSTCSMGPFTVVCDGATK